MTAVTVGLPVHNGMPYLPAAVESLLRQSHRRFSILIIDDGSTDDSLEYLRSLTDPRVTVLSQPRAGLTGTLNRMLAEVDTPWLVRHDADDIAYPDRVGLLLGHIERYPDAGMLYTYARYHQEGHSFGTFRTTTATPAALRAITQAGYLLSICHPTVALNVEKTRQIGGYRFDLKVEDIDLWWRMALAHDVRLVPEFTLGFRLNEESQSSSALGQQARNVLYVQYLLLSKLWGLNPRSYDDVAEHLGALLSEHQLRFRYHIRKANMCIGRKEYVRGGLHAARSLLHSPRHFARRFGYELQTSERPDSVAVLGEPPLAFASMAEAFWP